MTPRSAEFDPEACLQQVLSHLDAHRTGAGVAGGAAGPGRRSGTPSGKGGGRAARRSRQPLPAAPIYGPPSLADGPVPFTLVQLYPPRRFGEADLDISLRSLGLGPRSSLLLEGAGGAAAAAPGGSGGLAGSARWALGAATSYLRSWWYGGGIRAAAGAAGAGAGTPTVQQPQHAGSGSSAGERAADEGEGGGAKRQRPAPGGVRTLADVRGEEGEDLGQGFWDGNSTEFYGGPGGDERR